MKMLQVVTSAIVVSVMFVNCSSKESVAKLTDEKQKYSYMLGKDMATYLLSMGAPVDVPALLQGLRDTLEGKKSMLSADTLAAVKTAFGQKMQAQMMAKQQAAGSENQKEGVAFLEKNKGEKGVITTASGLQYKVLTEGKGPKPKASDMVTVNYVGTLLSGKEFDSSIKRGQPASFPVGGVIPGWTEALQLMNVGSKYKLFIPSALAYGERGAGQDIQPNSTLIFEVELLSIGAPEKPATAK